MWNCGYGGPTAKLSADFQLHGGWHLNPCVVRGSAVMDSDNDR